MTFELPFGKNGMDIEKRITEGLYEEIEEPHELRKLIANLLKRDPNERLTYSQIK